MSFLIPELEQKYGTLANFQIRNKDGFINTYNIRDVIGAYEADYQATSSDSDDPVTTRQSGTLHGSMASLDMKLFDKVCLVYIH